MSSGRNIRNSRVGEVKIPGTSRRWKPSALPAEESPCTAARSWPPSARPPSGGPSAPPTRRRTSASPAPSAFDLPLQAVEGRRQERPARRPRRHLHRPHGPALHQRRRRGGRQLPGGPEGRRRTRSARTRSPSTARTTARSTGPLGAGTMPLWDLLGKLVEEAGLRTARRRRAGAGAGLRRVDLLRRPVAAVRRQVAGPLPRRDRHGPQDRPPGVQDQGRPRVEVDAAGRGRRPRRRGGEGHPPSTPARTCCSGWTPTTATTWPGPSASWTASAARTWRSSRSCSRRWSRSAWS